MNKSLAIVALFSLMLVGCIAHKTPTQSPKPIIDKRNIKDFTEININGPSNVVLKMSPKYSIIIEGTPKAISNTKTKKIDNRLDVSSSSPIKITISLPVLNSLSLFDKGTVSAKDFNTRRLDLMVADKRELVMEGHIAVRNARFTGYAKVNLRDISSKDLNIKMQGAPNVTMIGTANLHNLDVGGHSRLLLHWVSGEQLNARIMDNAHVTLAGKTRSLNARVFNHARLDAHYLRAEQARVKTHNMSSAKIFVTRSQTTLASDGSSIYFYNEPPFQTNRMAENGAVLHLNEGTEPHQRG